MRLLVLNFETSGIKVFMNGPILYVGYARGGGGNTEERFFKIHFKVLIKVYKKFFKRF